MKVILGSDHAGFRTKELLKKHLDSMKIPYEDVGTHSGETVDYPDIAKKVALKVAGKDDIKGILVCGSGTGMAIAANKVNGIRAVTAYDTYTARMSRTDNDANVLGLRGRGFPAEKSKNIVDVWLRTPFSREARHKRRIDKISRMEK